MKKLRKLGVFIWSCVLACACCGLNFQPAMAAKHNLTLYPASKHVELDPGTKHSDHFTVTNNGEAAYDYKISVSPYQVSNYNYSPITNVENNYTQISKWITFSSTEGHLEPGESKDIPYLISVPLDSPAGGQYALISVAFDGEKGGNITAAGAVAMVVYARIAGETRLAGSIAESKITGFSLKNVISTTTIVENTGNVDAALSLAMTVKSALTGSVLYTNVEEPTAMVILPDTTRNVEFNWYDAPLLGVFNVEFSVKYLNENRNLTKTVVICPIWLILLVTILILALVVRIIVASRRRARHRGNSSKFSL